MAILGTFAFEEDFFCGGEKSEIVRVREDIADVTGTPGRGAGNRRPP